MGVWCWCDSWCGRRVMSVDVGSLLNDPVSTNITDSRRTLRVHLLCHLRRTRGNPAVGDRPAMCPSARARHPYRTARRIGTCPGQAGACAGFVMTPRSASSPPKLGCRSPSVTATLTDEGHDGSGIGVHSPVKGRGLDVANRSYNMLLIALRALGNARLPS